MSVRIKISEDGFNALNEVFSNQKEVGPFIKSPDPDDLMKALKLMEVGKENGSSKFTKPILFNIIKALLIQQKWADKIEGEIEKVEDEVDTEESSKVEENNVLEIEIEEEKSEYDFWGSPLENKDQNKDKSKTEKKPFNVKQVCKFYRTAKCVHGMTGKTKDKMGNICQYDHPPICQKFRKFEKNPEKGCQEKECDKLHYNFCKWYHDCKDMDNCKFYHPKRKQTKPMKSYNQPSFQPRDESRPRRAYEYNNCDIVEKTNFLGQQYPSQIPSWVWENRSQAYQYKQPFSNQENLQDQHKKEMRGILTSMEKLFNQAKSLPL